MSPENSAAGFSPEEQTAVKERAEELKAEARRAPRSKAAKDAGEADVLARIAAMAEPDRQMAQRLHEIVKAAAPELSPKTWYGMPAYALDEKVMCFFQPGDRFHSRYATLGFSDVAKLDEGDMWPTSFALTHLTPAVEERVAVLVKKAVGGGG